MPTRSWFSCQWLCVLMAGLVFILDQAWPPFERLELATLDWRFKQRGPRAPGRDVALVAIDEKSLTTVGKWTWSLRFHARLVEYLKQRGAALVVFDLLFTEHPKDPTEEEAFAKAMQRAGNVLLAAALDANSDEKTTEVTRDYKDRIRRSEMLRDTSPPAPRPPPPWIGAPIPELFWLMPTPNLLKAARGVGYVDLPVDLDRSFRRAILVRSVDNGRLYPHLALLAVALHLGVPPQEIRLARDPEIRLGERRAIPLSSDGDLLIDFAGPPPSRSQPSMYPRYSYGDVLKAARGEDTLPADAFRGKIVFVGVTVSGIYDRLASPYSEMNAGVETNANLVNAILQKRFFILPGRWLLVALLVVTALVFGRLLSLQPLRRGTLITLGTGAVYLLASLFLFSEARVLLPTVSPLVALGSCYVVVTAIRFQTEYRERLRTRASLDRYVTPQVAERVLSDPIAAALGGRRAEVSVLFSDVRDFTPMSEGMKPEDVIAVVNEYLGRMVPVVQSHGGTLLRFAGDEIFAAWGAPAEQPDHASRAVRAGLAMLAALRELNAEWQERGLPPLGIGVEINSGEAVEGHVGTQERRQYDLTGDSVNTAKRIEQLNKELGTRMLISSSTYDHVADLVEVRPMPPVKVKGKAEPLTVYEVLGLKGRS